MTRRTSARGALAGGSSAGRSFLDRPPVAGRLALVAAALMTAAACASSGRATADAAPAPVAAGGEVTTARAAVLLSGAGARDARWAGTYAPGAARARGLALRLTDGGGGALTGELTLTVTPRASTFAAASAAGPAPVRVTVPLTRGRYADGRLVLDTDAYYDAGCECTVAGTFRAAVRGDTLVGTYATRGAATAAVVRGRWRAVRRATPE